MGHRANLLMFPAASTNISRKIPGLWQNSSVWQYAYFLTITTSFQLEDSHSSRFTWESPRFMGLKISVCKSRKIVFGRPKSHVFPSHKNETLLTTYRSFWLSHCGRKHWQKEESPETATNRNERVRGRWYLYRWLQSLDRGGEGWRVRDAFKILSFPLSPQLKFSKCPFVLYGMGSFLIHYSPVMSPFDTTD